MPAAIFVNMLGVLYERLGDTALYEAVDGSARRTVAVKFDQSGSEGLEGTHVVAEPRVRVKAADFPQGVLRDDAFTINGVAYRASQRGMPINDGSELEAPLRLATA